MTLEKKTIIISGLLLTAIVTVTGMSIAEAFDEKSEYVYLTDKPNIPAAPEEEGCYYYSEDPKKYSDGIPKWIEKDCMTEEEMADLPHPAIGGSHGVHGVKDSTNDLQTYGLTEIEFTDFTDVEDSTTGDPDWSLQLNTNTWMVGANTYVVQFVHMEYDNRAACVWQIKTNHPQQYDSECIAPDQQILTDDYNGSVEGKVLANGNLQVQFCEIGATTQCWVKSTTDDNGLGSNWTDNSGTILGLGNSSEAEFTSPTDVTTKVKTGPAQSHTNIFPTGTLETNNLDYDSDSTSCAFNICTRTSDASN